MKRPVSVISPTYSASAIGAASGATPRSPIRSQTISAVHEASGTTRLTVPKRVLSWWWSMLRMCDPGPAERLGGVALEVAAVQEHDRPLVEVGRAARRRGRRAGRSGTPAGSGSSRASMNIRQSLPSAVRMPCMAISEPSASPSGFSWVTTTSLSASRSSCEDLVAGRAAAVGQSSLAGRSSSSSVIRMPAVDRVVVLEGQRGRVLERQLGRPAARCRKPCAERSPSSVSLAAGVVAEHAHVDASVAQVRAGLDSGHGHESNARVLEIRGDRVD